MTNAETIMFGVSAVAVSLFFGWVWFGFPRLDIAARVAFVVVIVALGAGIGFLGYNLNGEPAYSKPTPAFPVFNCQEDEIMAWVNARKTAECINVEEFEEGL